MIQNLSSTFPSFIEYDSIALNLRNLVFFFCLLYLSAEDLKRYRIPDKCLEISVTAWCMAIPFAYHEYGGWSGIAVHLLAAVVYGGGVFILSILIEQIFKKESLGGGDVKLIAVIGLYLGINLSLYALFCACIFGLLIALISYRSCEGKGRVIPFGPALAASAMLMLLYSSYIREWCVL